jgi:hypothetical protein
MGDESAGGFLIVVRWQPVVLRTDELLEVVPGAESEAAQLLALIRGKRFL